MFQTVRRTVSTIVLGTFVITKAIALCPGKRDTCPMAKFTENEA